MPKIIRVAVELERLGRSEETVKTYVKQLIRIAGAGYDLDSQNAVLDYIRQSHLSDWRKRTVCWCWKAYARVNN